MGHAYDPSNNKTGPKIENFKVKLVLEFDKWPQMRHFCVRLTVA